MRAKFPKHLDFIRQLPCVVCHDNTATEAAHLRYGDRRAAKPQTGMGIKPDDCWTLPLCSKHHAEQHTMGERIFWSRGAVDPVFLALALYRVSGDHELGEQIIGAAHVRR